MSEKIIAEIKLSPGEVGYYDDYSRIHLTQKSPIAVVKAGTNCTQLKRSVKSGRLLLIRGSFDTPINENKVKEQVAEKPVKQEEHPKQELIVEDVVEQEEKVVVEEVIIEEQAAEEVVVEEVVEAVQEEPAEEKHTKKRNKKQSQKTEE